MATLDPLVREVRRALGEKRIWLTEYGYQTGDPAGVSQQRQAELLGQSARGSRRARASTC